jgi:hypothetical protein
MCGLNNICAATFHACRASNGRWPAGAVQLLVAPEAGLSH